MIINLRGGLGNQMFQLAVGEQIQKKYGKKIRYSKFYMKREPNFESHINSLDSLNIEKLSKYPVFFDCIIAYYHKIKYKLLKKFNKDEDEYAMLLRNKLLISDQVYRFFELSNCKNLNYIDCYFQNYNYFFDEDLDLKRKMRVSDAYIPDRENIEILEQIKKEESVCLHIRRGDYTSTKWSKTLQVCDEHYYIEATKLMKKNLNNPVFFVFSNSHEDIVWIKKNYTLPDRTVYVDLQNCDYKELYLMYHCKHFILSNSSFSWWSQYLSYREDKNVIAPKHWTNSGEDYSGIFGSNWILI